MDRDGRHGKVAYLKKQERIKGNARNASHPNFTRSGRRPTVCNDVEALVELWCTERGRRWICGAGRNGSKRVCEFGNGRVACSSFDTPGSYRPAPADLWIPKGATGEC